MTNMTTWLHTTNNTVSSNRYRQSDHAIIQSVWRDERCGKKRSKMGRAWRELGRRASGGRVRRRDGLPLILWLSYHIWINQAINQFVCLIKMFGPKYASLWQRYLCKTATCAGRRITSYCYCSLLALYMRATAACVLDVPLFLWSIDRQV